MSGKLICWSSNEWEGSCDYILFRWFICNDGGKGISICTQQYFDFVKIIAKKLKYIDNDSAGLSYRCEVRGKENIEVQGRFSTKCNITFNACKREVQMLNPILLTFDRIEYFENSAKKMTLFPNELLQEEEMLNHKETRLEKEEVFNNNSIDEDITNVEDNCTNDDDDDDVYQRAEDKYTICIIWDSIYRKELANVKCTFGLNGPMGMNGWTLSHDHGDSTLKATFGTSDMQMATETVQNVARWKKIDRVAFSRLEVKGFEGSYFEESSIVSAATTNANAAVKVNEKKILDKEKTAQDIGEERRYSDYSRNNDGALAMLKHKDNAFPIDRRKSKFLQEKWSQEKEERRLRKKEERIQRGGRREVSTLKKKKDESPIQPIREQDRKKEKIRNPIQTCKWEKNFGPLHSQFSRFMSREGDKMSNDPLTDRWMKHATKYGYYEAAMSLHTEEQRRLSFDIGKGFLPMGDLTFYNGYYILAKEDFYYRKWRRGQVVIERVDENLGIPDYYFYDGYYKDLMCEITDGELDGWDEDHVETAFKWGKKDYIESDSEEESSVSDVDNIESSTCLDESSDTSATYSLDDDIGNNGGEEEESWCGKSRNINDESSQSDSFEKVKCSQCEEKECDGSSCDGGGGSSSGEEEDVILRSGRGDLKKAASRWKNRVLH